MSKSELKRKKDRRDRRDGWYLGELDGMHVMMPYIMPNRCDNEAVLNEIVDLTEVDRYLEKKNAANPDFKYTWFHVISAVLAKTVLLRPKMNYFISAYRFYERKDIQLAFVVKRRFDEKSEESLAKFTLDKDGGSPVEQVHDYVRDFVTKVRVKGDKETISNQMDFLKHVPRFLWCILAWVLRRLEYHDIYPKSLSAGDPTYSSIFISNLGSIRMSADYHHLFESGTISFFVVIGEKKMRPFFNEDGSYEMRNSVNLGMTIDERIADGFYFSRSIKLMRYLFKHPELLDLDVATPVDFE